MKNQTKFEAALEIIGQAIYEHLSPEDPENTEALTMMDEFMDLIEDSYVYVPWPESQEYMDEPWFDEEAILDVNNGSCYFIPTKYV